MKHPLLIALCLVTFITCKQSENEKTIESTDYKEETLDVTTFRYPESITKVFDAHGGIDHWNQAEALVFEIEKEGGNEKTTTDLKSRKALIEAPDYTIGFNGEEVWITEKDTTTFKSKPEFYYNLMFYFYAMPFVLADDGITYTNVAPLVFKEKSYPGIKVSYDAGVGVSPEDEYILYYDPETNKMTWLAYTVTYFTNEKSTAWHFIRYSDWQEVNGFQLPKTLEWYEADGFKIGEKKDKVISFINVSISKRAPKASLFEKQ
jgi:hypothetical protein